MYDNHACRTTQKAFVARGILQEIADIHNRAGQTDPEEANAFFPIFFEFQQSKWKIKNEARKKLRHNPQECPTEKEYRNLVNEIADAQIKIAKLEKNYIEKYLEIIPARKVLDVQHAEDRFQREMIKRMARGANKKR